MQQQALCQRGFTPFAPARPSSRMATRAAHSVVRELQQQVAGRQRSAVEVTQEYLRQLRSVEDTLGAFITVDDEHALAQARAIDAKLAAGEAAGPLAGVPIAVKDNICTRGLRTTAGSRVLEGYVPPFDATAAARLRAAGAVLIGKTNMDEFGMGSSTENSGYKPTRNPWDASRVPGGSSGGSAAAVAAGQAAAALGSDTGGSIRQPAHFCGVVGLKPSYGRVSRYGLIAYASSLDVVGPLAASVEDAALVLSAIAGHDPRDSTSAAEPVPDFAAGLVAAEALGDRPLAGKRVGVIAQTSGAGVGAGVAAAVGAAVAHLQALGAEVEEVSLPSFDAGLPAYYVLALSEASSNLARYDGVRYGLRAPEAAGLGELYAATRGAGLGAEVKRRILMGSYALSAGYYDAYYKRAQQVRALVQREMGAALSRCDLLVCPAAPTPAYRLGEKSSDPLEMYKGDLMTVNLNLSGLPAVVVPCGFVDSEDGARLPVGLQMVGRMFGEAELLAAAHAFEQTHSGGNGGAPPVSAAAAAAAAARR
ncbi:MAG: glutamyl tRNA amidotransferase, subunit A [Monoraphidium minutum]|nr:MAG: glutamyl tRNA amidotransferase, subunit A [Monoraphidium minutum]